MGLNLINDIAMSVISAIGHILFGWLPWWWWMVPAGIAVSMVTVFLYRIYKMFGVFGLVAVWSGIMLAVGIVLGRKTMEPNHVTVDGAPAFKFPGHKTPIPYINNQQHHNTLDDPPPPSLTRGM